MLKATNVPMTKTRLDITSFKGRLTEDELSNVLKQVVCEQAGASPTDPAARFRIWSEAETGGIGPTRRFINYELTINHEDQPKCAT